MSVFVKNNEAKVHNVGGKIMLMPGNNEVSAADWAEAEKIALVQWHIKAGHLEVVKQGSGASAEDAAKREEVLKQGAAVEGSGATAVLPPGASYGDLDASKGGAVEDSAVDEDDTDITDMTVAEAHPIISETYDRATLQRWKRADSRAGVQSAIDKQLELLKQQAKSDAENKEEL